MHTVTVWLVRTDQPGPVAARLGRLLDAEENRRAAAMPDPLRRTRFTVAHGAVREIVAARVGADPAALRWDHGPHGKPRLAGLAGLTDDLRVNLSTCAEVALVAVTEGRDVGVDIERLPADRVAIRLAGRYFPAAQAGYVAAGAGRAAACFTTLWSRKEACVKACGARLAEGLPLAVHGRGPLVLTVPAGSVRETVSVRDLPAPPGHRAAVSLVGAEPFGVERRVWPLDDGRGWVTQMADTDGRH